MKAEPSAATAFAPGRVELLGNHTDYNGGLVLGVAIERGLTVCSTRRDDGRVVVESATMGRVELPRAGLRPLLEDRWANYPLGVAHELDLATGGFELSIRGDLPAGAGLSSSAALEVATALGLLALDHRTLAPMEIARACQRAEHRFAGVRSGLLDQVTSLFGRAAQAVFFDARSEEVRLIPFPKELVLLVAESGRKRELAAGQYNQRREETRAAAAALGVDALRDVTSTDLEHRRDLPELLRLRAAHVVGENERVARGVKLLAAGDGAGFGALLNASHASSRRNFENSTPELDLLVSIAQELPGVLGARLTGAGFGGATLTLCEKGAAAQAARELAARCAQAGGFTPRVLVTAMADGARYL